MRKIVSVILSFLFVFSSFAAVPFTVNAENEQKTITFDANSGTTGSEWKDSQVVDSGANLSAVLGSSVPEKQEENIVKPPSEKVFDGFDVICGTNTVTLNVGDTVDYSVNDNIVIKYR